MSELLVRQRIEYFADSLWKRLHGVDCACPNCGSTRFGIVDRKYIVTELRRCEDCRLMYRAPSDDLAENEEFYQEKYSQGIHDGVTGRGRNRRFIDLEFRDAQAQL